MDLVLVRHARPERIDGGDGPADPELTPLGHRQAAAMAALLGTESFDAIYVSSMVRARQTAAPLEAALGLTAVLSPGVREFDATDRHYVPVEELKADKALWQKTVDRFQNEDMTAFSATVVETIEQIIADHRGHRVAVVCHGGVINVWAAHVLGLAPRPFVDVGYTSISRFVASSTGIRSVFSLNELPHLRGTDLLI